VLNWIWLGLVLVSVGTAAFTGRMEAVSNASLDSAKRAIELVIGLTGGMVLFLGLVKVASDGGLLRVFVRMLRPILRRLFPDVPTDHPAMGAMIMNFAANMLGLGNAATPFGIKAMVELDRLNPHPGVATNAMALFLAINTSSIVLFPPTGTVMVRLATDSAAPFAIWLPTLIASTCATLAAVTTCLLLVRLPFFRARPLADPPASDADLPTGLPEATLPGLEDERAPVSAWQWLVIVGFAAALAIGLGLRIAERVPEVGLWPFFREEVGKYWLLPLLIAGLVLIGFAGRVRVYDALVEGGREGLFVAVRIAPYLVAILVAIGMFRESGALGLLVAGLEPLTSLVGVPAEALPMALLRPLSGSGAFGVMAEILQTHGPDSFVGLVTSTLMGSTETTFYVLAVYLGAVRVREARHILPSCLAGDVAGFAGAVLACHLFFG
jgi:spore maturation protein SpmA/spore maturation protein SpmB